MNFRVHFSSLLVGVLLLCFILPLAAEPVYLVGEDADCGGGLTLAVNQIGRKPFTGGLGMSKKDLVDLQLTLVNGGREAVSVDPTTDFTLEIVGSYPHQIGGGLNSLDRTFTIHPGTQSRGSLFFRVDAQDNKGPPNLLFRAGTRTHRIVCDDSLAKLVDRSRTGALEPEAAVKLTKFLFEADRFLEARKILQQTLDRYPSEPRIVMQMAMVEKRLGNRDGAGEFLQRLTSAQSLDREDALTLARQAFDLEQYPLSQKVLEPFAERGQLPDADLLFLGRCWYFDRQYDRCERLLNELNARGFRDKTLYFTLGNIAEKRNELVTAMSWWEQAFQADPHYYEALFNIGVGYYKQNDRERARDSWRRVLLLKPDPETREVTEEALAGLD